MTSRLLAIASLIERGAVVADIGTDHAHLPIYLIENGRQTTVLASDIKEGPLSAARRNVAARGLAAAVELRLGGGLAPYRQGEVDVFVIAGMGGHTIADILAADIVKARDARYLILQAMQNRPFLRGWLYDNGFSIAVEKIVREGAKFYHIMKVQSRSATRPSPFDLDVAVAPLKDDTYYDYLAHLIAVKQALSAHLKAAAKRAEYDAVMRQLERLKGAYDARNR